MISGRNVKFYEQITQFTHVHVCIQNLCWTIMYFKLLWASSNAFQTYIYFFLLPFYALSSLICYLQFASHTHTRISRQGIFLYFYCMCFSFIWFPLYKCCKWKISRERKQWTDHECIHARAKRNLLTEDKSTNLYSWKKEMKKKL